MIRRRRFMILATLVAVVLTTSFAVIYHRFLAWKRFDVVAEGELYRSGILRDWQLRDAIETYGFKTVFSLTFTDHVKHQRICREMGVKRYFSYLPGDGVGPEDPYLRFLQIAADPANHPILVHCSAGVQRTGGAVALYRTAIQGWDFDAAIQEMVAKGNKGKPTQVELLRQLNDKLVSPDRCLLPVPKIASSRR